MDKIQFDRLLKPLTNVYDNIELDLIKNILDSLDNYNNVQGSMKWYLEKLADLGTIDRKNIEVFKKNKTKIRKCLDNIIETGSKSSYYLDKLEEYNNNDKLSIDISTLYKSDSFNKVVKEALKDTYDITDLIQTKALESVKEEYKNILNQAYIETASGIYTYQESIRKALDKFADVGITMATYSSGVKIGIEAVVRRDVITRVNKLIGDIDIENTKALKTNLVYVDQHLGARTRNKYTKNDCEAHAEWQGKVYKIAEYDEKLYPYGSNKDYPNFLISTGYGKMLGLKGINCYHNFEPFFNWEKVPEQIDLKENEKKYNLLQQQRAYERKIRKLKRKKLVEDDPDKKKVLNNQLSSVHDEFDKFLEDNKLNRDYSREYVTPRMKNIEKLSGDNSTGTDIKVNKSFLGNISNQNYKSELLKYENMIYKNETESAIMIEKTGDIFRFDGTSDYVNINGDFADALITHNHPSYKGEIGGSFGKDDFNLLVNHQDIKELRVVDEKYCYSMKALKLLKEKDYDDAYSSVMLVDDDYKHCVMLQLKEGGLIQYERNIRK